MLLVSRAVSLRIFFVAVLLSSVFAGEAQQNKEFKVVCISFYNLENLFDTLDTKGINDFEFTPQGPNNWNTPKYFEKLDNLARVISEIGTDFTPHGPAVLGVAEIENETVLDEIQFDDNFILDMAFNPAGTLMAVAYYDTPADQIEIWAVVE